MRKSKLSLSQVHLRFMCSLSDTLARGGLVIVTQTEPLSDMELQLVPGINGGQG